MGHAPDDLVGHAGHIVSRVLHVQSGTEGEGDEQPQAAEKDPESGALAFEFAVVQR